MARVIMAVTAPDESIVTMDAFDTDRTVEELSAIALATAPAGVSVYILECPS